MRATARRLAASIIVLVATFALAYAQVRVADTTPCDKAVSERATVLDDFSLVFGSGPVHASRGISTITKLNASGQASIETIRHSGSRKEQAVDQRQFPNKQFGASTPT